MKIVPRMIFAFSFVVLTVGSATAGPPLATDDVGTVDPGRAEIEFNGSYTRDQERIASVSTRRAAAYSEVKIATGLTKDLGISLTVPYTLSVRTVENDRLVGRSDGFGDATVELKYGVAELAGVRFAVKPLIIMPTGHYDKGLSEGRWQYGGVLISTKEFAEGRYAVHANLGYEHHSYRDGTVRASARSDFWSASVAGEMQVSKDLTAGVDFGLASNPDKSSSQLPVYALAGVRYAVNDRLDLDAGVKVGLTGPEDDVVVLYGLVLKF